MGGYSLLAENQDFMSIVLMRNSFCAAFVITIFYLCNCVEFHGNVVSRFLCKYSAEIYFSQFLWLDLSEMMFVNIYMRLIFVVCLTIVSVFLIHPFFVRAKFFLSNKRNTEAGK